jgi:hypothetical protein
LLACSVAKSFTKAPRLIAMTSPQAPIKHCHLCSCPDIPGTRFAAPAWTFCSARSHLRCSAAAWGGSQSYMTTFFAGGYGIPKKSASYILITKKNLVIFIKKINYKYFRLNLSQTRRIFLNAPPVQCVKHLNPVTENTILIIDNLN